MNKRRSPYKDSSGQAIVEMAIVFIPMLLLLFGIIDVGWLMYNQITLGSATREGLRLAAINSFTDTLNEVQARQAIEDRVIAYAPGLHLSRADVVVTVDAAATATGGRPQVTISVNKQHQYVGAMLWIGQNSINLNSTYRSAIATWAGNENPRYTSG
jgi:Flp pilus assembly protein TadG